MATYVSALKLGGSTRSWRKIRARRIREANGRCSLCGTKDETLEVHHIVKREHGGNDGRENTVVYCRNAIAP